jgi:hypothetical protein
MEPDEITSFGSQTRFQRPSQPAELGELHVRRHGDGGGRHADLLSPKEWGQ